MQDAKTRPGAIVRILTSTFPTVDTAKVRDLPGSGSSTSPANYGWREGMLWTTARPYGPQGGDVYLALWPWEVELHTEAPPPVDVEWDDEQLTGYAAHAAALAAGVPVVY